MTTKGNMTIQRYLAFQAKTYVYKPMNLTKTIYNPALPAACIFCTLYDGNNNYFTRVYVFSSRLTKSSFLILPN